MSELNEEQIIKKHEREKEQNKKIDALNENIVKLSEGINSLLELVGGKKKKEGEKENQNTPPNKIKTDNKDKDKDKNKENEPSLLSKFLGF
jgi:hypothetical protein